MRKTYKYRLQANRKVFDNAEEWLDLCRRLYNVALEQRITAYKWGRHTLSSYDQMLELVELKAAFPEYRNVGSEVLQTVLERLNLAYKGFFRRIKAGNGKAGFPRFKGRNRYDSFTLKQSGWKLEEKYLRITKVGLFKLRLSRPIEGHIKTVTIHRNPTGRWYVCFSCDNVPEKKLPASDKAIGIDVGLKSFLADSENNEINPPKYLREAEAVLRRKQRKLSRRKRGLIRVLQALRSSQTSCRKGGYNKSHANEDSVPRW